MPAGRGRLRACQKRRNGDVSQAVPLVRVAKEAGHSDEKLFEEQVNLSGVLLQKSNVMGDPGDLVNSHPPFNSAVESALLVLKEIVPRMRPEQDYDLLQPAVGLVVGNRLKHRPCGVCLR